MLSYSQSSAEKIVVSLLHPNAPYGSLWVVNAETYHSIMKDDYPDHSPCPAATSLECVEVLKLTAEGFSDMHADIRDMIGEDDRVSARIFFSCMHTGPGYGIPATGNRVEFEALEVFRLEDGLIAESWGYWPDETIRAQIHR